jgi:hypothetical protein
VFKVTEISQIAAVVKDIYKAMDNYWKILGWGPWAIYTFAPPVLEEMTINGREIPYSMKLALYAVGNVQFELIQPISGPTLYKKQLDTVGEGLHHWACYGPPIGHAPITDYDTLHKHQDELLRNGLSISQSGKFDEVRYYYYNTEPVLGGVIYETGFIGPMREPEEIYDPSAKGIEPPEFRVTEVSQLAVVVKDLYKAMDGYNRILGWGPWDIYTFAPPNLEEMNIGGEEIPYSMKLALTQVGSIQYELIEPIGGPSIYKKQLETRGEGLHHIACYGPIKNYDTLHKHQDELLRNGLSISQSGKFDEVRYYYYNTEPVLGGVIYETGFLGPMREPEAKYPPQK